MEHIISQKYSSIKTDAFGNETNPCLSYISKTFQPNASSVKSAFSWDTDGIIFVLDNSDTAIMCNERKLYPDPLTPMSATLTTAEGLPTLTQLVGALRIVLTNNSNEHHTYSIPGCIYDTEIPLNILRVPDLGAYFDDGAGSRSLLEEDITTIKSDSTKSHFVWDHGNHERHFIHGSRQLTELIVYVGHGYFNDFFTCVHNLLGEKVHYTFSSAYSIEPNTVAATPSNPHTITFKGEELDDEEPLHQWYCPGTSNNEPPTSQYRNTTPTPTQNVACSKDTKLPAADQENQSASFQLGMDLMYSNRKGKKIPAVYEGASEDGLLHTARFKDDTKSTAHNSNLQLIDQPDFSNMPKTPLDYRNEVGTSLLLE